MSSESAVVRFRLSEPFRQDLSVYAQRQYSAELVGDVERAKRLRSRLRDDQPPVGMGAGRYVYPLPDRAFDGGAHESYVLKFAIPSDGADGRDGREQNRRESVVWSECRSRYLVPVVAADERGYWLVMPEGESVDTGRELEQWAERAGEALGETVRESDIGVRNVVRLDGQFRLCDYGLP